LTSWKAVLGNNTRQRLVNIFGFSGIAYHIYALSIWRSFPVELHIFIHLTFFMLYYFLDSYLEKKLGRYSFVDLIAIFLSIIVTIYFAVNFKTFYLPTAPQIHVDLTIFEISGGILLLVLMLEASRRLVGLPYAIVIIIFVVLMWIGPYLPEALFLRSYTVSVIVQKLTWSPLDGIWGIPLRISASFVVMFFIFGKLMEHAGIGDLLMSLAEALMGQLRGGPAKVAVLGSGLIGSITAGPATNIVMTGTFTIPMMKRIGYSPNYSGAIECAASTGASITPPIMTAIAFIIAELAGIPYVEVIKVAFIPAVLYYFGILLQVHYQAVKMEIGVGERRSTVLEILKQRGHLLLPLVLLVILLFMEWPPVQAVTWSSVLMIPVSWLRKDTRMGPKKIFTALAESARTATIVALTLGLAGVVFISLFITGVTGILSHFIFLVGGDSLLIVVLLAALLAIVIGMSGPAIASYLIVVMVVAPLIVAKGLPMVAAHLFSLYYANIAFLTPPVALGAFVAAGLAKASFWRVGFTSVKLSVAGFLVPMIFVYRPGLLLVGAPLKIILATAVGFVVIACLASALEGYLLRPLHFVERSSLFVAALALIPQNLSANIGSIVLIFLVLSWQLLGKKPFIRKA
jgi:TRAP transporter 4TM/12TM fusion protein